MIHAEGDADLMITKTAVKSAEEHPTVVVGGDTNLLILQCLYANVSYQEIFFKSDIKTGLKGKNLGYNKDKTRHWC